MDDHGVIKKLLNEKIKTVSGKEITAKEALLRSLIKRAIEGDARATDIIFQYIDIEEMITKEDIGRKRNKEKNRNSRGGNKENKDDV